MNPERMLLQLSTLFVLQRTEIFGATEENDIHSLAPTFSEIPTSVNSDLERQSFEDRQNELDQAGGAISGKQPLVETYVLK